MPPQRNGAATTGPTPYGKDLSIDQPLALAAAASRLAEHFGGAHSMETIERILHSSYDAFAARSHTPHHLPLLAERLAKQRLTAQARVEGRIADHPPIVLFLCVHNAGRSQMALGFLTHLGGDGVIGWSGGQDPAPEINPIAVAAMAERGIDISQEYPKPWTDDVVRAADVVVTMGCGDTCPFFPGKRYLDWQLDDPAGKTIDEVRPIRDEIERQVRELLADLNVPVRHCLPPRAS